MDYLVMSNIEMHAKIDFHLTRSSMERGDIINQCMLICGIQGYKNGTPYSLGRHLRDAHSAQLMISNDRILGNTSTMLLVGKQETSLLW